jgi:hypothetical protein
LRGSNANRKNIKEIVAITPKIYLLALSFKKLLRIVGVYLSAACCIVRSDNENVIARTARLDAPSVIKRDEKKPERLP